MEITLNININAPALVDLIKEAMKISGRTVATGTAAAPAPAEPVADTAKAAPKASAKKAAVPAAATAAATPAAAADGPALTRDEVKARLSDYSADKRYGMDWVFALLKKYNVQRISDLPEANFAAFKAEIDEALAKPAADPLS